MSDNSQIIVDLEATAEEAPRLGARVLDWLANEGIVERQSSDCALGGKGHRPGQSYRHAIEDGVQKMPRLRVNGLSIVARRTVFDTAGNSIELRCDVCHTAFEPGGAWMNAVRAWYGGDDAATFACPSCGNPRRLTEWRGPRQWGFGCLGFEFWNWPPLSEHFLESFERELGHRIVVVRRHL